MTKSHLGVAALVVVATQLLLSACSSDSDSLAATYLMHTRADQDVSTTREQVLEGTLSVSDLGCVTLEMGDQEALLWAPKGSAILEDGTLIDLPGWGQFEIGEEVEWRGMLDELHTPIRAQWPENYDKCIPKEVRARRETPLVAALGDKA